VCGKLKKQERKVRTVGMCKLVVRESQGDVTLRKNGVWGPENIDDSETDIFALRNRQDKD